MDIRLALMSGIDIPIPECQLTLHQPRIREIAYIGEQDFFLGAQAICVNKSMISQDETLLTDTTNFQILMTIMSSPETKDKKQAILQVLALFLPSYQIIQTPRALMLIKDDESIMIDENNFDCLQKIIEDVCCFNSGPMDQATFKPANQRAQDIANKLMKARQRVAAQKGEGGASSLSQYLSVLTVGLNSMSLKDCMDLTVYQLYDLIERYSLYINWDIDVRSRLAGGKPDSQPDNWMKNIH